MSRVVVVGAGIVGASTAYHLAREGCQVVVVDPAASGAATAAGAGVISAVSTRPRPENGYLFAAVDYCADLVAELDDLGHDGHRYRPLGELIVALDGDEAARLAPLRAHVECLTARYGGRCTGIPSQIDGAEARRLCPVLGPVAGALWLPAVACVDGRRLRNGLLAAALAQGASLMRAPASLSVSGSRITGVVTPAGPVGADRVVLAAGAWSATLAGDAGVLLPVRPQRGQIVHVRLPGAPEMPAASGFGAHYLLSIAAGRLAFGSTVEDVGFEYALTVGGIAEVVAETTRMAPALRRARYAGGRVGFRPVTPDAAPLAGVTGQRENLIVATGLGSIGLTLGPYLGAQLARMARGLPANVPASYHPDRFG
ncbi:MAG TPA: FAD-dependent oxidoreductase [Rugosimonospora sp.]|nr:FAD-dependent oxidoreductase [Rugosimonospora sp.]